MEMSFQTKIISGFPGIGKTTAMKKLTFQDEQWVIDLDSSEYSWHPDFPANYIEVIQELMGKVAYIFVSTHNVVIEALESAGLDYTVVYPDRELKDEYLQRYKDRGSMPNFLVFMEMNWDKFLEDIEKGPGKKVKLSEDEYLYEKLLGAKIAERMRGLK